MPDGSTPSCVFIFRSECVDDVDVPVTALEPNKESMTGEPWHRLFLFSKKGYLTNELFAYIM